MEQKLAEFFRTECDYTSLLQDVIAAQAQMLNVHDVIAKLPDHTRPATDHVTNVFFLIGELLPILEPKKNDTTGI